MKMNETTKGKPTTAVVGRLKRMVMSFWNLMGTPAPWALLAAYVVFLQPHGDTIRNDHAVYFALIMMVVVFIANKK